MDLLEYNRMVDERYIINVRKCMDACYLRRPKHRSRFLVGDGELLPLILLEAEL